MAITGAVEADFGQILTDFQVTITYEARTKATSNITGTEVETYAAGVSKNAVFLKRLTRFIFDKEGIIDTADAYLMVDVDDGFQRYDRITYSGEKYMVENVIRRLGPGGVNMFDFCVLFKSV